MNTHGYQLSNPSISVLLISSALVLFLKTGSVYDQRESDAMRNSTRICINNNRIGAGWRVLICKWRFSTPTPSGPRAA
jgi:hypothetical protein